MVFREDVDVGSWTLGDLHKKSPCVQLRVEEALQSLQHVRATQLRLYNCALGVEDATADIAPDVHCTKALLGEKVVLRIEKPETTMGFMAEVNEAMSLDSIPMHMDFEGVDRISTQDLSLTQLGEELQNTPLRFVSHPTTSSSIMFCMLHLAPPRKGFIQGSLFYRTPSLTLAIGPPGDRTMVSPARKINLDDSNPSSSAREQPMCSAGSSHGTGGPPDVVDTLFNDAYNAVKQTGGDSSVHPYVSPSSPNAGVSEEEEHVSEHKVVLPTPAVSEEEEHVSPPEVVLPSRAPRVDNVLEDTLGRTIHRSDGR